METSRILIANNEQILPPAIEKKLNNLKFHFIFANDVNQAIQIIQNEHLDVIMTNQKLPSGDGFAILKTSIETNPYIPVIIITDSGSIESAVMAIKNGAYDYIQKPLSLKRIEDVLEKAVAYRNLSREMGIQKTRTTQAPELVNLVYESSIMRQIARNVLKLAKTDANVLIFGESGTGKEMVARSIHIHSPRADKPFIPVDCVAFPATLLESELFGFEKGAFTGAINAKPGVFELAEEGTLFLDEITELDYHMQAKLLRVLQERHFRRIGGKEFISVNVRIISATNRDPENAVKDKKLREDLYYRLNVVPIYVPPLRERAEDIPLLAHHFIAKYNPFSEIEIKGISNKAMRCLKGYSWPGNVRELENVIQRVMSLADHNVIELEDLPDILIQSDESFLDSALLNMSYKEAKRKCLENFGKQYFTKLLKNHNGNVSKVARTAGISRKTLYRLFDEHKIPRNDVSM